MPFAIYPGLALAQLYWTAPFRGWFGHKLTHIKHQHPSVKVTRLAMADKQIHVPFAIPKNCPK